MNSDHDRAYEMTTVSYPEQIDFGRSFVRLLSSAALVLLLMPGTILAAQKDPKPFLLHLNGIGGERVCDHWLVDGLKRGGFDAEVQYYDWTEGHIGIEALTQHDRHVVESRKVADLLIAHHQDHPNQPIYITSHSGGCGIAVWALELLPADVKVEQLFMFAPALSPEYDLSKALTHVKGKLHIFSSSYDQIVLGTGTKMLGTIDGLRVEASGLNGFVQPEKADPKQYLKLAQHPYRAAWLSKYGNAGSHICSLRPMFAKDYVAPILLTGKAPDEENEQTISAPTTRPAQRVRTSANAAGGATGSPAMP
jgi:hypothetical protein